ncbi:MAG: class I SAM-dependent methyltransferase [Candidatus Thorarchaeota archaeon]
MTSFLDYLLQPREFAEIVNEFHVSDREYLHLLLDALLDDNTVLQNEEGQYQLGPSQSFEIEPPSFFTESVDGLAKSMAKAVVDRFSGRFFDATAGSNLFFFDDALAMNAYSVLRQSALSFVPEPLQRPGKFLDLGCGSGSSTAQIWSLIMKNTQFQPGQDFQMVGIDIDENFINIANEEFYDFLKDYIDISPETYSGLNGQHPEFKIGSTEQIPYPDGYFNHIFLSQVLHWTDLKASLVEIYRALKPGGLFFGSNIMFPRISHYMNLMLKTIEGVGGFFSKEEMVEHGKAAGFSKFDFCTPTTNFRFQKPNNL